MKTEKRQAEKGERILVTNKAGGENRYKNGDVFDVEETYPGVQSVLCNKRILIFNSEYEVIIEEANHAEA